MSTISPQYNIPEPWRKFLKTLLERPQMTEEDTIELKKFWSQLQRNGGKTLKLGPLMFLEPPPGAPETFPFTTTSPVGAYPDVNGNATQQMDAESQLWYMFSLIKSMSHHSNLLGTTIANLLVKNERPTGMYSQLAYKRRFDPQYRIYNRKRDAHGLFKSLLPSPSLIRGAIVFKIDRRSFENADYDATKLMESAAKFSYHPPGTDGQSISSKLLAGSELQGYHVSLITRLQNLLNRLCKKASGKLCEKKNIIDFEWRNLAQKLENDTLGEWDAGHRFVTHHKFGLLSSQTLNELLNPGYKWTISDYAIFDVSVGHLVEDSYVKYRKWANKEKNAYIGLCHDYFLKPDDITWSTGSFNELKPGSIQDCIDITKRQKVERRIPEPIKEEPDVEDESSEGEDYEVVPNSSELTEVDASSDGCC